MQCAARPRVRPPWECPCWAERGAGKWAGRSFGPIYVLTDVLEITGRAMAEQWGVPAHR